MVGSRVNKAPKKWTSFRTVIGASGLFAVVFGGLLYLAGLQLASTYRAQTVSADPLKLPKSHIVAAVSTTSSTLEQPHTAPTQGTGSVQTCVPYTASLAPSQINLTTHHDGLTKVIDTPNFYQIYGNDAATLRAEVRRCAPKSTGDTAQYTAQTIYRISWQYSYVHDSASMCHVIHAKVGVHIGQILPFWQPTTTANAGLSGDWQAFMTALTTHENGHTALDAQYAQTLLDDLNGFPSTACDQLPGAVQYVANNDIGMLDQANDNYDSSTDHGATQGAILP
ncbi:MAG TPA: DUF922 domain-containing protein [Candidatus Microsaccharimonas sp.]|nr:DUF922 domain-containing protein [Candidatus Microsaccharimonas sp.]